MTSDLIRNLIAITREWLILTSMVVPERSAGRAGVLELKQGQCLLVPTLSDAQRAILREYFDMCRMFNVRVEKTSVSMHGSASVLARLSATA